MLMYSYGIVVVMKGNLYILNKLSLSALYQMIGTITNQFKHLVLHI